MKIHGNALLLAIDDVLLPIRKNLRLHISKPDVRAEAVLKPSPRNSDTPDNSAAHFYGTVIHDEGKFRMWYFACHWGLNEDWEPEMARQIAKIEQPRYVGPLCYAESDDGISWTKPPLRQLLFKGSLENNALKLPHAVVSCATVIKDESDPDPAWRYKMVYQIFPEHSDPPLEGIGKLPTCACAVSPDGLQWSGLSTPYPNEFVEHSSFYRHDGQYIISGHNVAMRVAGEGGTPRGRQGYARLSLDFDHWIEGQTETFLLPEPRQVENRGRYGAYNQVHLGVGAASFGNVCVGLYGIWHNQPTRETFGDISCDLGLVISNDGVHFREPIRDHVFLAKEDSPVPVCEGKNYPTILCQANGILNVGAETRIYHGRWRNTGHHGHWKTGDPLDALSDYTGEVALATLPRDRWGALGISPGQTFGSLWSAPIALPINGCEISLNAEGAKGMRVEIADEKFGLLPEYSGENSGRTDDANGLDCAVQWPHELSTLAGKTIRFRIHLESGEHEEPRLYGVNVKSRAANGAE